MTNDNLHDSAYRKKRYPVKQSFFQEAPMATNQMSVNYPFARQPVKPTMVREAG
jgi:hypothetical protein